MLFDTLHNIIFLAAFEQVMNLTVLLEIIHGEFSKGSSGSHTLHPKTLIRQFKVKHSTIWTLVTAPSSVSWSGSRSSQAAHSRVDDMQQQPMETFDKETLMFLCSYWMDVLVQLLDGTS